MTINEFYAGALKAYVTNSEWRMGQAFFNHLDLVRPDLSRRMRGEAFDPYYRDVKLAAAIKFVEENWDL